MHRDWGPGVGGEVSAQASHCPFLDLPLPHSCLPLLTGKGLLDAGGQVLRQTLVLGHPRHSRSTADLALDGFCPIFIQ